MARIVIIGAGITGLSAAYHLQNLGIDDFIIFEKDATVGGLCRSVHQDGFTFDYTGHLLHINDDYFRAFIDTIYGLEHFNGIKRKSYIYSHDVYTRYPFQSNLFGLPHQTIKACIDGYIKRPRRNTNETFYEWVVSSFGKGIAKHFFIPYETKKFDYPVKQLSASWTGRFVPQTSLKELLDGATRDVGEADIGYNARFLYPKTGGIYAWVDALYQRIKNPVQVCHEVKTIDVKNKRVVFKNGRDEPYSVLINTMPLDVLLGCLVEPTDSNLKAQRINLLCNSVMNFNLGIDRPDLTDKHWIYFPEKEYPFYRLGFPHNFAQAMAPSGCSSVYGEFSYLKRSRKTIDKRVHDSIRLTRQLFNLSDAEILTEKIIEISHAYVIFNAWRDTNLPRILTSLYGSGIHSVGRYGAWKYASMQEGILDGKSVAQSVAQDCGIASFLHDSTFGSRGAHDRI